MNTLLKSCTSENSNPKGDQFLFLRSRYLGEDALVCVAMMLNYHGQAIKLKLLRRQYPHFRRGMTAKNMIELFSSHRLHARALRCDADRLSELNAPCIAHWDWRRFVVLKTISEGSISVADPMSRIEQLNFAQLGWHYSGTVVEIHEVGKANN